VAGQSLMLPNASAAEIELHEIRRKIYPRAVHGAFARARWGMVLLTQAVFYCLPWLFWNGKPCVLLDLPARRLDLFGSVFGPQDVLYLGLLLAIAALSLFAFTAIAGRLWCGYACPQTVYSEIFLWVERAMEGDRFARIRLDAAPWSLRKFRVKALKHGAWLIIALWTAYSFVGYFTPIRELGTRAVTLQLGAAETFWILFYAFATYGNAGFVREQWCKRLCPYARMQSLMFNRHTLIVAYDRRRGEPRALESSPAGKRDPRLGDCVDCSICVQVCPTQIDIRNGLQTECIGCAACIDGCNQVMDKLGYPRGLIGYTTASSLQGKRRARP